MFADIYCVVNLNMYVYLMLTVFTTKWKINKQKEQEETFGGDMWVYSIDSDDGFKGVYLSSE